MSAQPKPRPKLLDKREAKSALAAQDRAERLICKQRSGGQCEVIVTRLTDPFWIVARIETRCRRRASQNHHLIGGIGRRNRGESLLAAYRIDVCDRCHDEITGHVLKPVNEVDRYEAATVRYERIR